MTQKLVTQKQDSDAFVKLVTSSGLPEADLWKAVLESAGIPVHLRHEALATVGGELGLSRSPTAQRRRPLVRPAQIEDVHTGLDHRAVDHACDDRRHLAGRDRRHSLRYHQKPDARIGHT